MKIIDLQDTETARQRNTTPIFVTNWQSLFFVIETVLSTMNITVNNSYKYKNFYLPKSKTISFGNACEIPYFLFSIANLLLGPAENKHAQNLGQN